MIALELFFEDGSRRRGEFETPLILGRAQECGVQISHWRVARQHLRIVRADDGFYLDDLGSILGTRVNGRRINRYGPLTKYDEIIVGPCLMRLAQQAQLQLTMKEPCYEESYAQAEQEVSVALANAANLKETDDTKRVDLSKQIDRISEIGVRQISCPDLEVNSAQTSDVQQELGILQSDPCAQVDLLQELRAELIQAFNLRRNDIGGLSEQALKAHALTCVAELLDKRALNLSQTERDRVLKLVVDEAIGLGVIEELLQDPMVTEIMVNRYDQIYVEVCGRLSKHTLQFSGDPAVRSVIERIVYPLGRRIDDASPMVDARLPDGSRLNAVIPPISVNGASFTIRKFPQKRMQMHDLIALQAIPSAVADFLRLCVKKRLNILVSGGTGSGKTTLLNVLAGFVDSDQRIVTIEDSAELMIQHPHVVPLEARRANAEGQGAITIRDLVKNALRMRPDRIVIGEVRGAEAIDMLAAMNTGHEGSLTTLHANSPRDALSRLETMVLSGTAGLPLQAIREQIASGLQLVVQQTRLESGRRLITAVTEITGIESGTIQTQQLAKFDTARQCLVASGIRPSMFDDAWIKIDSSFNATFLDWFVQV